MENQRKLRLNDKKDPEFRNGELKVTLTYIEKLFQDSSLKFSILYLIGCTVWLEHNEMILYIILRASPATHYPLLASQRAAVAEVRKNLTQEGLEALMLNPPVSTIVKVKLFKQGVGNILRLDSGLKRQKSLLAIIALLLFLAYTSISLFSLLITLLSELLA
jgi:hypothetical protein